MTIQSTSKKNKILKLKKLDYLYKNIRSNLV